MKRNDKFLHYEGLN
ncbi:hypothetical protein ABLJ87_001971 [Escherichia coli]